MEPPPLFMGSTVYRERGAFLRRLEQLDKAKAAYDEGYKVAQDDVRLLIGRSMACSDAVRPLEAYDTAQLALKIEPDNLLARVVQARALYTTSEFERSCVYNYRGSWKRTKPPYFLEGIAQGIATVEDCIGANVGRNVMTEMAPLIKDQLEDFFEDNTEEIKKVVHKSRIPAKKEQVKITESEARRHEMLKRVLAMKYLGPMCHDKFFLERLTTCETLFKSANKEGCKQLKALIDETINTLCERQAMLRSQKPYYSIKYGEKCHSNHQDQFKKQMLINERIVNQRTCEFYLKSIYKCYREHRLKDLMNTAERMQRFLDKQTKRNLPDKQNYVHKLYRLVGESYLSQHRLSYKLSEHNVKKRVAFLMGLPVGRSTSYDSVRANHPVKYGNLELAAAKATETLRLCDNETKTCFLYYELATLSKLQKNPTLSKFYAKRCQAQAQEIGSPTWWLNGCFMLIGRDMNQGNINDVRTKVDEAIEWTKQTRDPEELQAFLRKCAEMVGTAPHADERRVEKKRQAEILDVMDPEIGIQQALLFKRIAYVPDERQFHVVHQAKTPHIAPSTGRRLTRQFGISVVDGPDKAILVTPKHPIPGNQIFDTF